MESMNQSNPLNTDASNAEGTSMQSTPQTKTYLKIGEAAGIIGVPASTLRFWEKQFPQIKPMKNKKGDRFYTPLRCACFLPFLPSLLRPF